MNIFRNLAAGAAVIVLVACTGNREPPLVFGTRLPADQQSAANAQEPPMSTNEIATGYVKLVLALGELDPGYVDAYYGPAEWREQAQAGGLDAKQIEAQAQHLIVRLMASPPEPTPADPELAGLRRSYLKNQLGALSARAAMLQGHKFSFDDEARALYDVAPPHYSEAQFEPLLQQLDVVSRDWPVEVGRRGHVFVLTSSFGADPVRRRSPPTR